MAENVHSCAIFDDLYSYGHFALGILTKMLAMYWPLVAGMIFIVFTIYESIEDYVKRERGRAKCDLLEYILGYLYADILLS